MNQMRWLVSIISLLLSQVLYASEPVTFENTYAAKLYGFNLEVTSRLTPTDAGLYQFYFDANAALGRITETSKFKWDSKEHRAIPLEYNYKRSGLGKNRNMQLLFDWDNNQVSNSEKKTRLPLDASKKIQDSLSYQVQLHQDLLAGKKKLGYFITNGKKVREYKFEIDGEEVLDTPLGKVATVRVKRVQTSAERETYAWFAKDFQYLLVRLQQEENGSAYTIYISKASINGKAIDHF